MNEIQKIDITSNTILRVWLISIAFIFLYLITDLILIIIAAVVIASTIEPLANKLQSYKVPRALSVVLVYIAFLAVFALTITLMIPPLVEQTEQLIQSLPQIISNLKDTVGIIPDTFNEEDLTREIQASIGNITQELGGAGVNLFERTREFFSGFMSVFFVFILAFYLVMERDALKKLFRLIVPKEHIAYVDKMIDRSRDKIGRWVLAQLALAVIIGTVVSIGLWLLGVKYALALGLLAGVMEIIPVIGPIVAAIPAVLIGLSQSLWLGVAALVFYVVVQQLENNVLIPNMMRKATGLNPIVTLMAIILGARLGGVVGMILAVPIATILSVLMQGFFYPNNGVKKKK